MRNKVFLDHLTALQVNEDFLSEVGEQTPTEFFYNTERGDLLINWFMMEKYTLGFPSPDEVLKLQIYFRKQLRACCKTQKSLSDLEESDKYLQLYIKEADKSYLMYSDFMFEKALEEADNEDLICVLEDTAKYIKTHYEINFQLYE